MFLLQLRHLQTFILIFILPFALQFSLQQLLAALPIHTGSIYTLLFDVLPASVYVLWLWAVGLWLHQRLPAQVNPLYFHLSNLYFILYTILFVYTLSVIRDSIITGIFPLGMLALLMPLHLLSTFCYLYIVYFVARAMVSAEQHQTVSFSAYAGTYFLFLLLPVGIWWLQPRLNRLYLK
ncbi:hypothetical protein [Pontibacter rugosus]|uniref:Uncharacterized protein n=1 Tax=Pontibacter rugosus TaxID=1745966 RepID=A0ABW3SW26_9BACT